jgi:hypothetical protein
MRRERNFETSRPIQVAKLEKSLKKLGLFAHTGTSGTEYEEGQEVLEGTLYDEACQEVLFFNSAVHTHKEKNGFNCKKDGVVVKVEYLSNDQIEDLYGGEPR